ncbi:MAG TPA: sigma-54 dependent transcriptional regulator [Acidobacteriaceae bacterium]|nr:sigma-54 dependent transcriptional regulator [Acidobacteriaceae bacterium]
MSARPSFSQEKTTTRPRVLVLESNLRVLNYLKRAFSEAYDLRLFSSGAEFLRELEEKSRPSLVLLAWDGITQSMPAFSGLRALNPDVPVLILATSAEMADYEVFGRLGVNGVVLKPFVDDTLELAIAKHLLVTKEEAGDPKEVSLEGGHSFVRSSKRMREVEAQAQLVAKSDIPVLILGESGTGKEIIAMYTHQMSRRAGRMFLKVNCAAMPADLLESELFGYEQGAFTGATKSKPGKFELCDGGTIFLDEIGEMPPALQAKLLHVLQDGTFSRLGSRGPTRTDVRVIAATNVNMKDAMARKTFREDLYYRLNGLSLLLPPLRERLDEIPAMAAHFMRKGAKKYDLQPLPISSALLDALGKYNWPGNLRELENVINRYLILQDERTVIAELNQMSGVPASADKLQVRPESGGLKKLVRGLKGEAESSVIAGVLEETGWNRKAAANDLQISYKALLYKIKQYDLSPKTASTPQA